MFNLKSDCHASDEDLREMINTKEIKDSFIKEAEIVCEKILNCYCKFDKVSFNSTFNKVFKFHTAEGGFSSLRGPSYIFRLILPVQPGYNINAYLQQWANQEAIMEGVKSPKVIITDTSHKLIEHDFQIIEYRYEKTLYDIRQDEMAVLSVISDLVQDLNILHKIHGSTNFGLLGYHNFGSWKKYLNEDFNNHMQYLDKNKLCEITDLYNATFFFDESLSRIPDVVQPILCHGDLSYRNVLIDQNNKYAGLIDWEDSLFGDPIFDLANLATFHPVNRYKFIYPQFDDQKKQRDFFTRFWCYYLRITIAKTVHRHRFGYTFTPENGVLNPDDRLKIAVGELKKLI